MLKPTLLIISFFASLSLSANLIGAPVSELFSLSKKYKPGDVYQGVRLLGALKLDKTKVDGVDLRELSGAAWDEDAGVLYLLSDDGYIAHTRPRFENNILVGLDYVKAALLQEPNGEPVEGKASDTEGLAILKGDNGVADDAELLVSFEVRPRLHRYAPDGRLLAEEELPALLRDIDNYEDDNKAVEAVTVHPELGIIVAPERRLAGDERDDLPLFALPGGQWRYTPKDKRYSNITELEMAADGRLLVLERRFKSIFSPVIFSLRALDLPNESNTREPVAPQVQHIVSFASNGETRVDNFEGIAHHRGNRYFIVSDDNESAIQKTLLLYLEILPDSGESD